ncbi:hypothetical protein CA2015_0677 [Cyclobacterium amurskyense]|uniref:Uncharacterized protein n=1 Tax=Cyclobacterium amurskyense TaxID=320787 RepID=A0A0H4PAH8_9BACT|nr:hypothetical protein CA2015_0677 [Cyclobacterium amurskyense]
MLFLSFIKPESKLVKDLLRSGETIKITWPTQLGNLNIFQLNYSFQIGRLSVQFTTF